MKSIHKNLLIASSVLFSSVSIAGTTTWEWNLNNESVGKDYISNGDYEYLSTNDITNQKQVDLHAFSDTAGQQDDQITAAKFDRYSSGWGVVNYDSESGSPEHAFDNKDLGITQGPCPTGYRHSSRGGSYSDKCYKSSGFDGYIDDLDYDETDYDMALISFDTSVALTEIDFGWTNGGNGDFTLLAYTGGSNSVNSPGTGTWSDVNSSSDWTTIGNYENATNSGYYAVNQNAPIVESKFWLLGAYNSVFDKNGEASLSENNDAFKIRGLKALTQSNDVSSPSAFALLLMGLGGLYIRRNKKA
ncbi:hypothetical protein L0668_17020 [Paraglaciecola aquimarina]|uniref:PEP-CTERM sorting domain-containing protein n=1 Tax=Paraglaciecola algarum TaxID=3050085 RepID=A0ABS9DCU5_9ALTE|nr:exosortase-dependent surface protein XDP1 [Paraglaciecola sp. G1-23]MCF2949823.1 hypothetical protein [Paraglaciecola sp. G1-23]